MRTLHSIYILALGAPVATAFAPLRPVSRPGAPTRTLLSDKLEEYYVRDTTLNVVSFDNAPEASPSASAPAVGPPPSAASTDEAIPTDVGKEIFLSSMQENIVSAEMMSSDILNAEDILSSFTTQNDSSSDNNAVTELPETFLDGGSSISHDGDMDAVGAVLAASEEAAAKAEASLPEDVLAVTFSGTTSTTTRNDIAVMEEQEPAVPEILPASEVVGTPSTTTSAVEESTISTTSTSTIEAPRVSKILKFAIPATGVWLCGPLLSLIDTASVGILSGTIQQAALNPAVAVTDYAALLIAFLYTGTTNLIASAREQQQPTNGAVDGKQDRTRKSLIGALQLSTFVGAGLGAILFAFAKPLLRTIIGNDGISPAVFAAAMKYVKIRALGMPAAAVIGSAQAACLGMQDIKSPLYVLAVAAVVNFLGDMMFVGSSHRLIGGAAGAAWATVFSQYAAVAMFVHWLCHKPKQQQQRLVEETTSTQQPPSNSKKVVNLSKAILELTGSPKSKGKSRREQFKQSLRAFVKPRQAASDTSSINNSNNMSSSTTTGPGLFGRAKAAMAQKKTTTTPSEPKKEKSFSVRGFLQGSFRGRDLLKFPSRELVKEFSPYVLPVTSTQVGRVSGYVAMSHVVSSSLGTVSMAAQQVIVSLFYCLCPIADSLSLTAQSFVPAISEKAASTARSLALRKTILNFAKAGAIFGSVMAGAVACIPLLSRFFTTDQVVISMVNQVVPLLVSIFSVHGLVCAAEGLLLGQKDLGFLGKSYAGYFFAVPWFMMRVKRAALAGTNSAIGLTSVWSVFLGYQLFRFAAWMVRVGILQRRTEHETNAGDTVVDDGNRLMALAAAPAAAM